MNKSKGVRCNKYAIILNLMIIVGMTLVFGMINKNVVMMGEDFDLISFYPNNPPSSFIQHLSLITNRVIKQMTEWNIRIGEQLSIIFGSIDMIYFQVLNTVMAVMYIVLIPVYALGKKLDFRNRKESILLLLSFILIIVFQPALGEIFFWRTGSTNYLWAMVILLLFGLPLRGVMNDRNVFKDKKLLIIVHTLLGFFAGLTNENTIIVFISLYIGVILLKKVKKEKVEKWIWSSLVTLIGGFITLLAAPSTAIRIRTYKDIFGIQEVTIKDYIYRGINVIGRLWTDNRYYIVLLISCIIIYLLVNYSMIKEIAKRRKASKIEPVVQNIILLLVSTLSVGALIGSPYVETRAFLMIDFFMLVCIISIVHEIVNSDMQSAKFLIALIGVILGLFSIVEIKEIFLEYKAYHHFIEIREQGIEEAKRNKLTSVQIATYERMNDRILNTREEYIQSDSKYLNNYYNIDVIYDNALNTNSNEIQIEVSDIIYGLDYIEYLSDKNLLQIYGWAAIQGQEAEVNSIKILLKSDDEEYKFDVQVQERIDVAEYYNDNRYRDTGIAVQLNDVKNIISTGIYNIGICITSGVDNKEHIIYTPSSVEIY